MVPQNGSCKNLNCAEVVAIDGHLLTKCTFRLGNKIHVLSSDFYTSQILPYAEIIIKICRAYTDTQEDFEDYYQEVCLQIWRSRENFRGQSEWTTWIYRVALNVCLTLLKKRKNNPQHSSRNSIDKALMNEQVDSDRTTGSNESVAALYRAIRRFKTQLEAQASRQGERNSP